MGVVAYDPAVLAAYARALYAKASRTVLIWTALGLALGVIMALFSFWLALDMASGDSTLITIGIIAGAMNLALFGIIGNMIGQWLAFKYRLEAQLTLCQVEIEKNTRMAAGRTSA